MRRPQTSYIAFVIDKPQHDYNPHGTEQPEVSTNLKTAAGHNCELFVDSPGHFQVRLLAERIAELPTVGDSESAKAIS